MEIDLHKIQEIYGKSSIKEIHEDINKLIDNANYLLEKGFSNIEEIIEYTPYAFLQEKEDFQEKLDNLIKILGVEYIEKIEENMELLEYLNE